MNTFKTRLPYILLYSRLFLGFIVIALSQKSPTISGVKYWILSIVFIGLLTDIFDGILARKMGISTPMFRRYDSSIDVIFWICVSGAVYTICPTFFHENWGKILMLLIFESLTYIVCFLKFKREVATHSLASKFWTLILCATLLEILISCQSIWLFPLCFYIGILTRLEILAILILLKNWENDIPSVFHALKLRRGQKIERNKLFNG